ncbi:MAG: phosphoglycerate dehydrogenase [Deltaproteobacteria bacterium]|nr:phosphoglycerate dehydrogenase [Deltaproteobacteria bacterium]
MTFRVLVSDKLAKEGLEIFNNAPGIKVDDKAGIAKEDLLKIIGEYDALVIRSATKANAEIIAAGKSLKVIGRAGIGVDNVDLGAATRAGIVVMNTPDGNATTAAEHTIALMMSMARKIPQATASMKAGMWEKKKFMGNELCNKTFGVIGLGNIGRIVADRAVGLKMRVIAHDPFFDADAAAKLNVELVSLDDLVERADIITVHTPLTNATRGLISVKQIEHMKPGVLLVNCARGGIMDEAALLEGLNSGKIASLALDVFSKEPVAANDPLVMHEKVICTPHLGASTMEAQVQVAIDIANQIIAFARGEPAKNAVNLPTASPSELQQLGPYVDLARRLGSFCAQLINGQLKKVEVQYWGEVTEHPLTAISQGALAGVLTGAIEGVVNAVNARVLAQERGIELVENTTAKPVSAHDTGICITVSGAQTHTAAGILIGGQLPRIVSLDGVAIDAALDGHILVIRNVDKPGMIGQIGTVLGQGGINITNMQMGRDREASEHLALINVEEPAAIDALAKIGGVRFAQQVTL